MDVSIAFPAKTIGNLISVSDRLLAFLKSVQFEPFWAFKQSLHICDFVD